MEFQKKSEMCIRDSMYGLLPKYYGYRLTQNPIRMDTLGCELNFTLVMTVSYTHLMDYYSEIDYS